MRRTAFNKECVLLLGVLTLVQFAPIYDYCNNNCVGTQTERVLESVFWYCVILAVEIVLGLLLWRIAQWYIGDKPVEVDDVRVTRYPPSIKPFHISRSGR